jgi:hypothetical protein
LHRPAVAAWCPSAIITPLTRRFSDAGHGRWDARAVIGLRLDDARRLAARHGCRLRVVGGKDLDPQEMINMDLRFDRVNVDVTDGIVTTLDGAASGDMVG